MGWFIVCFGSSLLLRAHFPRKTAMTSPAGGWAMRKEHDLGQTVPELQEDVCPQVTVWVLQTPAGDGRSPFWGDWGSSG